jgi:PAS domain S-box-containing protein
MESITARARAEQQLHFQASLLNHVRNAVIATDLDGKIIFWNAFAEQLYQWKAAEVLGKNAREVIVPADQKARAQEVIDSMALTGHWEGEFLVRRKDGSTFLSYVHDAVIHGSDGESVGYVGVSTDISERKQAEEALARAAAIIESSDDAIISKTLDGIITSWNKGAARIYGYSAEEVIGRSISILMAEAQHQELTEILKKVGQGEMVDHHETSRIRKDGKRIDVSLSVSPIRDASGTIIGASAIVRDITEPNRAEAALRTSEERLRVGLNTANVAVFSQDLDLRYLWMYQPQLGYTTEQVMGRTDAELLPANEEGAAVMNIKRRALETGQRQHAEVLVTVAGEPHFYDLVAEPFRDTHGEIIGLTGASLDISQRKRAEEALIASERNYRNIFALAPVGIYQALSDGTILTANKALVEMLGYESLEELLGVKLGSEMQLPEDVRKKLIGADGGPGYAVDVDMQWTRKDGSPISVQLSAHAIKGPNGEIEYFEGFVRDNTERKRVETERDVISEVIQSVNLTSNLDELLTHVHRSLKRVLYAENCCVVLYNKQTGMLETPLFVDLIEPNPFPMAISKTCTAKVFGSGKPLLMNEAILGELLERGEVELVGRPAPSFLAVPLMTPAETIGVIIVQHYEKENVYSEADVELLSAVAAQLAWAIERQRAEKALRESEERYRDLVENSREFICTHDLDGLVLSANRAAVEVLGYGPQDYCGKRNFREILAPEVRDGFTDYLKRVLAHGADSGLMKVQTKAGEKRIWEYYNTLRTEGVSTPIVRGMAHDVTDRRRAEEALRESEERYRELFESAQDAIYVQNLDGIYTSVNRAAAKLTGYDREEILGKHFEEFVAPEYLELVRTKFSQKLTDLAQTAYLVEVIAKDGRRVPVELCSSVILKHGVPVGIQGIARDITKRKRAEDALRQQKEMLQKIFDHIPVMIRLTGPDGRVQLVNREYERMTGWTLAEIQRDELNIFADLYPDKDERERILDRMEECKGEWTDFRTRVRDGRVIDTSWANIPLSAGMTLGIGQDISVRKRAEERLRGYSRQLIEAQEAERQHIARELHDQIGQVLTAVRINLQRLSNSAGPEETRTLSEQGMTIIDEALEQVRSLSFELRPSILDGLGLPSALRWYADQYTRRTGIKTKTVIKMPVGQTRLKQELETACFRIVQEALTNVVRHAGARNVFIYLKKLEHQVVLSVKDNGRGFERLAANPASGAIHMGLQGMKDRALSLGGTLEVESAPGEGTIIRASLPVDGIED